MSVNTAHANRGVLIHSGEHILLYFKNVEIEFPDQLSPVFQGTKPGYIYLTSHRIIFRSRRQAEMLQSFSAPFVAIDDISLQELTVESTLIRGKVRAQPNGNFNREAEFKITFVCYGGIEFFKTLLCVMSLINESGINRYLLPPYKPPRVWYEAPLEVHKAPSFSKKWLPIDEALFQRPSPNSVFMTDNPPPFPGIDNDCKLSSCESNVTQVKNVKFSTLTESTDGFIHPPIYGVLKCIHQNGVFPHQAANPSDQSIQPSSNSSPSSTQ